jgi:ribonuclease G
MGRPQASGGEGGGERRPGVDRADFKAQRGRDRRIKSKPSMKPSRANVSIQDLLKEGQEVLVQVAKDPISTKGARLTCHISLPGRHLVCMPTIDHVGVSRRIERDDERRKLREYVEESRPKGLGFIVRTASGRGQSESRIKQDVQYLSRLWSEIREKAAQVTAPALVYEDLNSVLRAIRDWVTEDIDKIVVDSRFHYNEIQRFVSHFMPSLKQKVELYHGDLPIFDAYNISTELARGLERKVWLKSGGYLVVDQAEALVAIDVNTGRYVGKKNLEDTILKTNLEAVQEIAYQLRLRNCGGIIILDLIDMEREENKQRVYRALEEALKKDRARPSILKISELGLVEMTRKRTRDTMVRALCESCVHCEGKGFVKSKQTVGYEILREIERVAVERDVGKVLIQAHPDVIDVLAIDERDTLDQIERRYRKQVYLQAVPDFHGEQFEVVSDKKEGGQDIRRSSGRSQEDRQERDDGRRRGRGRDRERGGRDRGGRDQGGRDRDQGGRDQQQSQPPRSVAPIRIQSQQPSQPQPIVPGEAGADPMSADAAVLPGGNGVPRSHQPDGFDSEEDRLAFLRAQAAQDAALARLGGNAAGGPTGGPNTHRAGAGRPDRGGSGGGGGGGAGGADDRGSRRRRGRRGGRNNKVRGPDRVPNGGSGIRPVVAGSRDGQADRGPDAGGAPRAEPASTGGGDVPAAPSGGNGGGSDHSNPPT